MPGEEKQTNDRHACMAREKEGKRGKEKEGEFCLIYLFPQIILWLKKNNAIIYCEYGFCSLSIHFF